MGEITDGTSNTFAAVAAGDSVPWYVPDVMPYDGKLPLPQLGAKACDDFLAGTGYGSLRFIQTKSHEATVPAAVSRDGGEVLKFQDG